MFENVKPGILSLIDSKKVADDAEKAKNYKALMNFVSSRSTRRRASSSLTGVPTARRIRELVDTVNKDGGIKSSSTGRRRKRRSRASAVVQLQHYPAILYKVGDKG